MIEKDDWRLHPGDEQFYNSLKLKKIKFPEFWQHAYRTKNDFYKLVADEARDFSVRFSPGEELPQGERAGRFWHAHCQFCWEKFITDMDVECYCTPDFSHWICSDCYEDFKDKFNFKLTEE